MMEGRDRMMEVWYGGMKSGLLSTVCLESRDIRVPHCFSEVGKK